LCRVTLATRLAKERGHVLPRTIASVLDSSDVVKDVAITWASSLARWYEADLHVHVRRSSADKSIANKRRKKS
jgi:hypothetical protein